MAVARRVRPSKTARTPHAQRARAAAAGVRRKGRAVGRLTVLCLSTAIGFSLLVAGQTVLGRTSARARRFRQRMFKGWCRLTLGQLGIWARVDGDTPSTPFLLVSNHLSYVDILLLGAHLEAVFLARHDIAGWPVIGWAAERLGTVFINRRDFGDLQAVNAAIAAVVRRGDGLIVFPEGTSTAGRHVAPFRSPVLQPAASLTLPVAYAALSYATPDVDPPAHEAVCWWGDADFAPHFWQMLQLSRIDAMLTFGPDRVTETDRKLLAQALHGKVSALFRPVVTGEDA